MNTDHIFCGICGKSDDVSLFRHIREEHGISAEEYRQRCPNAPLVTTAFGDYIANSRVQIRDDTIIAVRELLGVTVPCAITSHDHVPAVDERFAFDPDFAKPVLLSLLDNDRILLVGPTGSGKSSLISQMAARLNWPLRRINLHGETGVSDFLGTHKARDGAVYFQYGILPTAMKEGHILVVEELDAATPEILFVLQSVLEEGGTLTLTDNGGEIITPHPNFRLVATANTLGTGDESGLYAGTSILNGSHLDRWTAVFNVGYLGDKQEASVILAKVPELNHSLVDGLVNLANAVRKAVENEELYVTFSTRRLLALARKIKPLGLAKALEITVLNKLPRNDRAVVAELAQRHLPMGESAA